jgi:prolipoprotein diacylglyceryl transferase
MSIPSPDEAFQVFTIPLGQWLPFLPETFALSIRAYALCILVGIIAAIIVAGKRLTARGAEPGIVLDIALWAVPLGIVGARLFHVLTHPDDYFGSAEKLAHIPYIWEGGLAIFGGLIGGAIGVFIGCRLKGIRFFSFADAMVPGLLLAQVFGRLGNYFNHELFGWPTDLPWGLEIEQDNPAYPLGLPPGVLFQPTFLYEMIWGAIGVALLFAIGRRLQWGRLLGVYLIWYGAGRIVWETIRIDPSEIILGLRTNVWMAIAAVVLGLVLIVVQGRRHPGHEVSPYLPGREWVDPAAAVDSEEVYSETDEPGDGAASAPQSNSEDSLATSGARTGSS